MKSAASQSPAAASRRPVRPLAGEPDGERLGADLTRPGAAAELGHEPAQDPAVLPAGARLLGTGGANVTDAQVAAEEPETPAA